MWFGAIAILVLLEATRRSIGYAIVILAIIFLLYAYFGNLIPGIAGHRGYSAERIISQLYLGGGGIFGTPLGVSSTFVILIVLFGAVLEQSGASKTLMDIATGLTGRMRGGPAKAAVVGSSLMGMISGTAVANVLTTGTISIPLMKRNGYTPRSAGAVEAVASTGGQLMPPIMGAAMGAAAFLMSDITSIDYFEIAAAALLPAAVYYVVLFSVVHLEAMKHDIPVLELDDLPSPRKSLSEGGFMLLSIVVFIYLLFDGYSVMYASFWALVATVVLSLFKRQNWLTPKKLLASAISGARAIIPVATACACAGIIIGVITMTGLGLKFSSLVVTLSGGHLFIALVLTMVASLILGMGLPTAAAYILRKPARRSSLCFLFGDALIDYATRRVSRLCSSRYRRWQPGWHRGTGLSLRHCGFCGAFLFCLQPGATRPRGIARHRRYDCDHRSARRRRAGHWRSGLGLAPPAYSGTNWFFCGIGSTHLSELGDRRHRYCIVSRTFSFTTCRPTRRHTNEVFRRIGVTTPTARRANSNAHAPTGAP